MTRAKGAPVLLAADKPFNLEPLHIGAGLFTESWLQGLIHSHPELVPASQIEPGFGELQPVCRELNTPHGPIDNLMITPEGNIALIEVKLWRNPESRRKVVAQALDYASCLFDMSYEDFEAAILATNSWSGDKPRSLYEIVSENPNTLDEPDFIDAVTSNLRKGRALILVVGDGIRQETERLAGLIESHAGAHFTFALIELELYRSEDGNILVIPNTLAKTQMISRGIVEISDLRTKVYPMKDSPVAPVIAKNISAEQFFESMASIRSDLPERLQSLIRDMEPLGIYPNFGRSMSLKSDLPEGKSVNLGYITRRGELWTDAANVNVPHDISHPYIEELAAAFETDINRNAANGKWHLRLKSRAPRITEVADHLSHWPEIASRFLERLKEL